MVSRMCDGADPYALAERSTLRMRAAGASEADLARGVAAALAVFRAADLEPWWAMLAERRIEAGYRYDPPDLDGVTNVEWDAAIVARAAGEAAIAAACGQMQQVPGDAGLYLEPPDTCATSTA